MPEQAITEIVEHGLLGAILVIALFAIWRLWSDMKAAQSEAQTRYEALVKDLVARDDRRNESAREDNQALIDRLVKVIESNTSALTENAHVIEAAHEVSKEALLEIRQLNRAVLDDLRSSRK